MNQSEATPPSNSQPQKRAWVTPTLEQVTLKSALAGAANNTVDGQNSSS